MVYVLIAGIDAVGLPYNVPLVEPRNNPVGSAGCIAHEVTSP